MLMVDNTVQLGSVGSRRSTTRSDPVGNVHNPLLVCYPPLGQYYSQYKMAKKYSIGVAKKPEISSSRQELRNPTAI
ncbi:hypothetical protein OUZ56_031838 [Daphnia magna]|uniref:Uncharacterized protein n=1 Tax=Daphnia magna TaxID=35525 RepID=A0ABQ9ZVD2_9CRUS|nr:hypothetical protein OUZ56_031838 [Daphnia magna]